MFVLNNRLAFGTGAVALAVRSIPAAKS